MLFICKTAFLRTLQKLTARPMSTGTSHTQDRHGIAFLAPTPIDRYIERCCIADRSHTIHCVTFGRVFSARESKPLITFRICCNQLRDRTHTFYTALNSARRVQYEALTRVRVSLTIAKFTCCSSLWITLPAAPAAELCCSS